MNTEIRAQKVDPGEENSPAALAGIWIRNISITSWCSNHWAIPALTLLVDDHTAVVVGGGQRQQETLDMHEGWLQNWRRPLTQCRWVWNKHVSELSTLSYGPLTLCRWVWNKQTQHWVTVHSLCVAGSETNKDVSEPSTLSYHPLAEWCWIWNKQSC